MMISEPLIRPPAPPAPPAARPAVAVRRVMPQDQAALRSFYAGLSPESRRARFLGCVAGIGEARSRSFCMPDHEHQEGFVAEVVGGPDDGAIAGHLCLVADGDATELAVAVADAYQGHGLGRRLFEAGVTWARAQGIGRVWASAFADNARVLRLLTSAPAGATVRPADGGLVEVEIPIPG